MRHSKNERIEGLKQTIMNRRYVFLLVLWFFSIQLPSPRRPAAGCVIIADSLKTKQFP